MEYEELFGPQPLDAEGDLPPLAERIDWARRVIEALPPDQVVAPEDSGLEYTELLRRQQDRWVEAQRSATKKSTEGVAA